MNLSHVKRKTTEELHTIANDLQVSNAPELARAELIAAIVAEHGARNDEITSEGVLEVLPDGFGFLRAADSNYLPGTDDIYVSPSQIRRFDLRTGDSVTGLVRPPKESERYYALLRVHEINGGDPSGRAGTSFDERTPLYPNARLQLETDADTLSTRILDLCCPLGFGQRCLIASPPRAGRTTLLRQIANALEKNYPDTATMVLLIDERPEEVTEMQRAVRAEVIASTFDEPATRHVQVAEIVIEKARRMAENGKDVVILLDSITSLVKAYNTITPPSGKLLSGEIDTSALHKPKRFFGAARNLEGSGSLTIMATVLVDTGSRMDEVIFEQFQGTGNAEIHLDGELMHRRLFPCIDLKRSGTRREELLLDEAALARVWPLRKQLRSLDNADAIEIMRGKLGKFATNSAFLAAASAALPE